MQGRWGLLTRFNVSHHIKEMDGSLLPSLGLAGETSAGPSKPAPKETALVTRDAKHLQKPKEVHLPSFQTLRLLDMASACLPSETWQQCTWKEMVTITMDLLSNAPDVGRFALIPKAGWSKAFYPSVCEALCLPWRTVSSSLTFIRSLCGYTQLHV